MSLNPRVGNLLEIQVRQQKIHDQARRTAGRIAVPLQQVAQQHHIFGSFQRIVVVRIFTQVNSAGPKLLITLTIADAYASPVIALQQDQGA